jgi:hypothetical protein
MTPATSSAGTFDQYLADNKVEIIVCRLVRLFYQLTCVSFRDVNPSGGLLPSSLDPKLGRDLYLPCDVTLVP